MPRQKKYVNWEIVEKKMESGCPAKEIAGAIDMDLTTFYERFRQEFGHGFADKADSFQSAGHGNIRFTQYMKALQGNTNMLTLLGREWLGQSQIKESTPPNEDFIVLKHENMLLKAELEALKETVYGNKSEAKQELSGSDSSV